MRRPRDRGFALLAVAVALTALSLLALTVVSATRQQARDAIADAERLKLEAAIDGAMATVARDLGAQRTTRPALLLATQTIAVGEIAVTVSARPEAAKLDLNQADTSSIAALLREAGVAPARANELADRIADWRDADDLTHLHGAEASAYLGAGLSYVPTNRGFETLGELALVMGANADLVACLQPDITIFSGRAFVDPASASPRLRKALGLGEAPDPGAVSVTGGQPIQPGEVFEIVARSMGTPSLSRQTILRVTGNPRDPVWVLSAASPAPAQAAADAACARLAAGTA